LGSKKWGMGERIMPTIKFQTKTQGIQEMEIEGDTPNDEELAFMDSFDDKTTKEIPDKPGMGQRLENIFKNIKDTVAPDGKVDYDYLNKLKDAFFDAMVFGYGEELEALEQSLLEGKDYKTVLAEQQKEEEDFATQFPKSNIAARITGAVPTLAIPGLGLGKLAQAPGIASKIAGGAGQGAIYSGLYASGDPREGETRTQAALRAAPVGAVTGGIANPVVGKTVETIGKNIGKIRLNKPKAVEQLQKIKTDLYDKAEAINVRIPKSELVAAGRNLKETFSSQISKVSNQTKTKVDKIFKEIDDIASNDSIKSAGVGQIKSIQDAIKGLEKTTDGHKLVKPMRDKFDNIIAGGPGPIFKNRREYVKIKKQADDAFIKLKKNEIISGAVNKANEAKDFTRSLETSLRNILTDPKKRKRFTPDEQRLMRDITQGTTGSNALKLLSQFSLSSTINQLKGVSVPAALGTGAGIYALGGSSLLPIAGTVATMAAGQAAKAAQNPLTRSRVGLLSKVAGDTGKFAPPTPTITSKVVPRLLGTPEPQEPIQNLLRGF